MVTYWLVGSDAKMKFTLEPAAGDVNFQQWKDAIKSLVRGPAGLPSHFRNKVQACSVTIFMYKWIVMRVD